ncbi:MAG: hydroxysqualene dehydroxylase HpnE [Ignavibacteria bacterium]
MKSVIIIGGGLAGISAAVNLANKNFKIKLIESSPFLGGRAKSYFDKKLSLWLDIGQHLLITGYKETLDLFEKIDAKKNLIIQKKFCVKFRDKKLNQWKLTFSNSFEDLINLLIFKNLKFRDKINFLNFLQKIKNYQEEKFENISVLDLLKSARQSEYIIENFWRLFVESTMNSPIEKASARVLIFILKKMFFENLNNACLIIPEKSFYESFINPAEKFLFDKSVEILKNTSITRLKFQNDKVLSAIDNRGEKHFADLFVLAVPYHTYLKLMKKKDTKLNFQSIINANLIFENYDSDQKFYALWGSPVHWIFFHKTHITLTRSSADELQDLSESKLREIFLSEFREFFPEFINKKLIYFKIIKEKRATFISDISSIKNRIPIETEFSNLFIAGDFVDTGYPSTIESAVKSGRMAAQKILEMDVYKLAGLD